MKDQRFGAVMLAAMLLAGCQTIPQEAKDNLVKPIDCRRAGEDIAILESEKASVLSQISAGAGMVMPMSAAIGILSGDYPDRVKVASGEYNKDIEEKIAQIKAACYKKKRW